MSSIDRDYLLDKWLSWWLTIPHGITTFHQRLNYEKEIRCRLPRFILSLFSLLQFSTEYKFKALIIMTSSKIMTCVSLWVLQNLLLIYQARKHHVSYYLFRNFPDILTFWNAIKNLSNLTKIGLISDNTVLETQGKVKPGNKVWRIEFFVWGWVNRSKHC